MDDKRVDHYAILGLPSGEEGAKLSKHDITKAYRSMAKKVHPDKRPGENPSIANSDFRRLRSSYELLMDHKRRKSFDDRLRKKRKRVRRQKERDRKRRKMRSDLEERERSASFADHKVKARDEEERRIKKQLDREVARIRAMYNNGLNKAKVDKVQKGKFFVKKNPKIVDVRVSRT